MYTIAAATHQCRHVGDVGHDALTQSVGVQVVGGGPAGACAAETLAKGGVETYLIERKMDNCKPCGGAIPLCMVDEFDLPEEIIDRKVRV